MGENQHTEGEGGKKVATLEQEWDSHAERIGKEENCSHQRVKTCEKMSLHIDHVCKPGKGMEWLRDLILTEKVPTKKPSGGMRIPPDGQRARQPLREPDARHHRTREAAGSNRRRLPRPPGLLFPPRDQLRPRPGGCKREWDYRGGGRGKGLDRLSRP